MNGAHTPSPEATRIVSLALAIAILSVVALAGAWDVCVLVGGWPGATVSAVLQRWAFEAPQLVLLVGLVLGHLLFPQAPYKPPTQ